MQSPRVVEGGAAAGAHLQAAPQLGSLPPDLLVAVFAQVPLAKRQRRLALVCRQWAELVHSPALLASLDFNLGPSRLLPCLRALAAWMERRAAGHVRQLTLRVETQEVVPYLGERLDWYPVYSGEDSGEEAAEESFSDEEEGEGLWGLSPAQEATAGSLLATVLTVHGSSLRHLDLELKSDTVMLSLGPWLAPLSGLTSLRLSVSLRCGEPATLVSGSLTGLASLQQLQLLIAAPRESSLLIAAGAALPAALTSLRLRGLEGGVPQELSALQRLRELHLEHCLCENDQYSALASLRSSLTALTLSICDSVPSCLGELTALRSLVIEDAAVYGDEGLEDSDLLGDNDRAVLEAALPCLQQLTAVYCISTTGLPDTPAALSALQQLETVAWVGPASAGDALPSGPWLARLRRLALPCLVVSDDASLAALGGAQQLEQLGVTDCYRWYRPMIKAVNHRKTPHRYHKPELQRILGWAAQHASLQQLVLEAPALKPMAPVVKKAHKARPGLLIAQSRDVVEAVCGYARDSEYLLHAYGF